jgi:hypothetical protein
MAVPRVAQGVSLAVLLGLTFAAVRPAGACAEEAAVIDATLARQAHKAAVWDNAWAITFGALAVGQGSLALGHYAPGAEWDDKAQASMWIGAGKSAIGSLSHLILRLKTVRGGGETEPCAHLEASRRALRESAKHQKTTFWLNHAGSLALNLGGLLVLGLGYDAWKEGVMSFALGWPVGLLSVYTQPRGAWHARVVRTADYSGLAIAGTF